jgi:hypothetical protein
MLTKRRIVIIVVLALVLIGGGVGIYLYTSASDPISRISCGSLNPVFSSTPLRLNDLTGIVPIGNFAPPGHVIPTTHTYWILQKENGTSKRTAVYAPGAMTITRIGLFDNASAPKPYNSYRLDFTACDQIKGYFILISELNDKLKSAFHEPYDDVQSSDVGQKNQDHSYSKEVRVQLSAGELIGYIGGFDGAPDALDFGLADFRVPAATVGNPNRWRDDERHYVCPIDYFNTDVKGILSAQFRMIGENEPFKTKSPLCGSIYQDVVGSLQGSWFAKSDPTDTINNINGQIALGIDTFDPDRSVFSFGNKVHDIGIQSNTIYTFDPSSSGQVNLKFSLANQVEKVYCYETTSRAESGTKYYFNVELTSANSLKLSSAQNCTVIPSAISSNFLEYIR